MTYRYYSDSVPQVTLSNPVTSLEVNFVLSSSLATYLPSFPFVLRLDSGLSTEELVLVTAGAGTSGNPYVVQRGYGTTIAAAHDAGAIVDHAVGSPDFKDSRDHEVATSNVHGIAATNELVTKPLTADKIIYVSPRGNDSADGRSWGSAKLTLVGALNALSGPGVIQIGAGSISTGGNINLDGRTSVTIRGMGCTTAGASPASIVTHSGSGSTAIISCRSAIGVKLQGFMLLYNNAGFTGDCIDMRLSTSSTAFYEISDMYIGGAGVSGSASAINIGNSQSGVIQRCNFAGNGVGIQGRAISGDYISAVTIRDNQFINSTTRHISNLGEGHLISGNAFEALTGGIAGSIVNDFPVHGVSVTGNWFGDVTSGSATQLVMNGEGWSVTDNLIGFNTGIIGLDIAANSKDFTVSGNYFHGGTASGNTSINIQSGCTMYDVSRNQHFNVATKLAGSVTSSQIHRAVVDDAATFLWQNSSGNPAMQINTNNGRVGFGVSGGPHSGVHVGSSMALFYTGISSTLTLNGNHCIVGCTAAAGYAVNLPTASGIAGRFYTVIKKDNNANAIAVTPNGAETINGVNAAFNLAAQWKYVTVISDGTGWLVLASN